LTKDEGPTPERHLIAERSAVECWAGASASVTMVRLLEEKLVLHGIEGGKGIGSLNESL
jgi:hypothetical protein